MLVLFVVSHYRAFGGHESVMNNLAKGLSRLGYQVVIGAFSFEKPPPYMIPTVTLGRLKGIPKSLDSNGRIDIIHNHHGRMNYYSIPSSKPFIFHYHGASNRLQEINLKISLQLCKKRISKIIYVSNFALSHVRKVAGSASSRIPSQVIYNGVDNSTYHNALPKKYKKGDPQLLFVGNLYPHKNVIRIVEEVPQILRSFPDFHFQIVGDGESYPAIKDLIQRRHLERHVELVGRIEEDELRLRYSSCDLYISASGYEANPVPLIEAMASGKPLLVSNIPPNAEVVNASNAGLTFSVGDSEGIKNGIRSIMNQKGLFENNAKKFAKENDWSNVCEKVSKIYQEIFD